jgi:hypothetical protein
VLPPQGRLTKAAKTQIAEDIANIHCNATVHHGRLSMCYFSSFPMATEANDAFAALDRTPRL